ncbi:hypothetical protein GCM10022225_66520 [Plantactinospora mayteni]|uniref:Uncharacterized protein n=1 Tax=Plantactinospora mayteni TaxID=566021 RepID=A0ABQ4EPI7_9ACTN|nr:hypothetical protein Pma05_31400 [Plantactinospora mayteni]
MPTKRDQIHHLAAPDPIFEHGISEKDPPIEIIEIVGDGGTPDAVPSECVSVGHKAAICH